MSCEIHMSINLWCALYHKKACDLVVGICVGIRKIGFPFFSLSRFWLRTTMGFFLSLIVAATRS